MMNRQDYNFTEYQMIFNEIAKKVITESFENDDENFDADAISEQIDDSQITYNKIQKILNCPEMIKSHAYLYALDMDNVSESDKSKIDHLYDLGKARGVIQENEPEDEVATEDMEDCDDEQVCGGPDDALTDQEMTPVPAKPVAQSSAFTVLYSAMKDGEVKTGEYFSSAVDMESAQRDCVNGLSPLGYSNIRVLGIEKAQNAVDMDTLSEDDSEEYEEQETTPADNESEPKDEQPEEKETEESPAEDEKEAEAENTETEEAPEGEESDKQSEEEPTEEAPEDEGEPTEEESVEEEPEEEKKLTPDEKHALREEYTRIFKSELQKTKLNKSVNEMSIGEKAKFWTAISEKWSKEEPEEFMTKADIEKLNSTVVKTK
jgi:hypothetical protein